MNKTVLVESKRSQWQWQAYVAGYNLAVIGWVIFGIGLLFLAIESVLPPRILEIAGAFIVPGWLLLRFAAGLFPFGRRMFRWQR